MPDAISLLKEHRPPVTHEPDLEALERILAAPAPARRRRSTRPGRILVAAGAAAAIAVAATPLLDSSPDVVARAAAALNDSDSILHFKATWSQTGSPVHGTIEGWRADAGRKARMISDGRFEVAEDRDTRAVLAYDSRRNEIRRLTPELFDQAQTGSRGFDSKTVWGSPYLMTDDLAALLERARHGDADVHLLPDGTVRGVPVHRIQITVDVPQAPLKVVSGEGPAPATPPPVHVDRIVSVDRGTYLPVRVEERSGRQLSMVTDYSDVRRLPITPENEAQLHMAPHPGAKEVVVGPRR